MILFSNALILFFLAACIVSASIKNKKLTLILVLTTAVLHIMCNALIYSQYETRKEGYDRALKKISKELKLGNSTEVIQAIDESVDEETDGAELSGGKVWMKIQGKINMKKASEAK
ncbi:MAG: hypothetical protein NE330_00575 [Lentisphaeraceae bacterium]|nr:hypothetical protein [Lentisphaeraceae bacterium]